MKTNQNSGLDTQQCFNTYFPARRGGDLFCGFNAWPTPTSGVMADRLLTNTALIPKGFLVDILFLEIGFNIHSSLYYIFAYCAILFDLLHANYFKVHFLTWN
jgi:hypothetical protein